MLPRGGTRGDRARKTDVESTACGSGAAVDADTTLAATRSVEAALRGLGGRRPSLGFLFVAPDRDFAAALRAARRAAPGADFVAVSTAGELTERGLLQGGVTCLLVALGSSAHALTFVRGLERDASDICGELSRGFAELVDRHTAAGRKHSITVLFGDGLSPTFEKLVAGLRRTTSPTQQIVGGGAADANQLVHTKVGAGEHVLDSGAVAIHVFSKRHWGVGVDHGVSAVTGPMAITRAEGNWVLEIDREPALDVYRRFAAEQGVSLDESELPAFLVQNEFGVLLFDDIVRIRAPIRVDQERGALFFAGEVPEGSQVCIVRGETPQMLEAASRAAHEAKASLGGARATGVLVFSCVCRSLGMGSRYAEEIACVRDVFPGVPIAGFCSYGEVARTAAKLDGYHNDTIVVVAIPE